MRTDTIRGTDADQYSAFRLPSPPPTARTRTTGDRDIDRLPPGQEQRAADVLALPAELRRHWRARHSAARRAALGRPAAQLRLRDAMADMYADPWAAVAFDRLARLHARQATGTMHRSHRPDGSTYAYRAVEEADVSDALSMLWQDEVSVALTPGQPRGYRGERRRDPRAPGTPRKHPFRDVRDMARRLADRAGRTARQDVHDAVHTLARDDAPRAPTDIDAVIEFLRARGDATGARALAKRTAPYTVRRACEVTVDGKPRTDGYRARSALTSAEHAALPRIEQAILAMVDHDAVSKLARAMLRGERLR